MINKLNVKDVIDNLSSQTNLSKEETERFITELFNTIELGLSGDGLIKIKDLGTFKITLIQERESIDVNTQEKILIPSHRRISFIPAQTLKSLVNKPFAHFETTPLNDGIVLENVEQDSVSESSDNEDDDLIEGNDYTQDHVKVKVAFSSIDPNDETLGLTDNNETFSNEDENKESLVEDSFDNKVSNIDEEKQPVTTVVKSPIYKSKNKFTKSKPKRPFFKWYIVIALFMIVVVIFAYNFYLTNDNTTKQGVEESDIPKPIEESSPVVKETQELIAPVEAIETVKMISGKTLRLIALDKFGSREFWVYIYLNNKDKIKNPDVVPVGIELALPNKIKYDIDATNPQSVAKAKKLGDEEMKKFW